MRDHIWVVQIKEKTGWMPTTGASLTKKEAEIDLTYWENGDDPDDEYRIRKYVPEKEG